MATTFRYTHLITVLHYNDLFTSTLLKFYYRDTGVCTSTMARHWVRLRLLWARFSLCGNWNLPRRMLLNTNCKYIYLKSVLLYNFDVNLTPTCHFDSKLRIIFVSFFLWRPLDSTKRRCLSSSSSRRRNSRVPRWEYTCHRRVFVSELSCWSLDKHSSGLWVLLLW